MYFIIFVLLFWNNINYIATAPHCCPGENVIFENRTCSNGEKVTVITCKNHTFWSLTETTEVSDDDQLLIYPEGDYGHLMVETDKYCLTKQVKDGPDIALVCNEEGGKPPAEERITMLYIKNVCAFISVLFLLAVFVIYARVQSLRDIEGRTILNFIGCLLLAHVIMSLLSLIASSSPGSCKPTIFFLLGSYLCAYNWLSVLSFHLWRITIRPVFNVEIPWLWAYCCYGYGLPILLCLTALIDQGARDPTFVPGAHDCWLDSGAGTVLVYFYGPSLTALFLSAVLQLWSIKKVWIDVDTSIDEESMARLRKKSITYAHLLLVTFFLCLIDFIMYLFLHKNSTLDYIWDLFDCRNFLIGGIMFFILVVLRNKVLKALAREGLFGIKFPQQWEDLIDEDPEILEEPKKITIIGHNSK